MYEKINGASFTWRYLFLANGIISFLIIIAIVVNMSLHRWFVYCFWEFGLFYGGKIYDEIALHDEYTIFDVHSDACGSVKLVYEEVCPDLCDYLYRFAAAGGVMIFLGIICLVFHLILMWAHCIKASQSKLKIKCFWLMLCIPTIAYTLGLLLYVAVIDPLNVENTAESNSTKGIQLDNNPRDIDMQGGFWMAFVLVWVQAFQAIFGLVFTRKGFKPE